jgi:diguanylate cyclase (GGDEF)-like protein
MLVRIENARLRAAADRARAARDLALAASEREAASRERAEAARSRTESAVILKVATTDELTGAWTRKFGLEQVERELERATRTHAKLLLAFIDVEGLKAVNDTLGHQAGDALLQRVGETLRANVRTYDVIVRYGGDEFLCAMPNIGASEARARFEKIVAELRAVDAEHAIAFGLAEAEAGEALTNLVARADAALLSARRPQSATSPEADGREFRAEPVATAIAFKAHYRRFAIYVLKATADR